MANATAPRLSQSLSGLHSIAILLVLILIFPSHTFTADNKLYLRDPTVIPVAGPIIIPPSGDWDGTDGPWSSFRVQVGTPAQNLKVFISTASAETWVITPGGCSSDDPANCGDLRGGEFRLNNSTTWAPITANNSDDWYYSDLESTLGYKITGEYGSDKVSLGSSPALQNQVVAGITSNDFDLGLFGLSARNLTFSNSSPILSYLTSLQSLSQIPSASWGYTAGNRNRLGGVPGSLILGGYDASMFNPGSPSFDFNRTNGTDDRWLTVPITSITTTNASVASLLDTPIWAYIDSSVPHIWLPTDVCALFEQSFGLSYDNSSQLYTLSDSQHAALLVQNPSVTFTLGNQTSGASVNVTLPYEAFNLTLWTFPTVSNSTQYFPLRRATNTSQYTLGRTFLQEAYLIVDYDRQNFSVSQRNWDNTDRTSIVTIFSPGFLSNITYSPNSSSFSQNDIIGSVIGIFVIIVIIALGTYFLVLKPRCAQRNTLLTQRPDSMLKVELDAEGTAVHEADADVFSLLPPEIDGRESKAFEMAALEEVVSEIKDREAVKSYSCIIDGGEILHS